MMAEYACWVVTIYRPPVFIAALLSELYCKVWCNLALWFWAMKRQSGHLHYVPKQYAWYSDPSSSSSPDSLLTRLLYYTKCQSRKRDIIQPNIYGILPKLNQVIYTLDTICIPKFMIIARAVLQVFCWQGPVWVKFLRMKRGIIQSNSHRILWKVH